MKYLKIILAVSLFGVGGFFAYKKKDPISLFVSAVIKNKKFKKVLLLIKGL